MPPTIGPPRPGGRGSGHGGFEPGRSGVVQRHPSGAIGAILPDGQRRHFQHGPIDLVIDCDGPAAAREEAFERGWARFAEILPGLVSELATLRQAAGPTVAGPVARRMRTACLPHVGDRFVSPMAAVAGAVADHVLDALAAVDGLDRAYVNNGGDIALYLAPGRIYRTGIVFDHDAPCLDGLTEIAAADGVRGIATSGWQGRSYSLGIADSVTVLAATAAAADVAATLIANAVDIDHPSIARQPAASLDPDSDLGDRLVTTAVGDLPAEAVARALDTGAVVAAQMRDRKLIAAALLTLRGETRHIGHRTPSIAANDVQDMGKRE